MLARLAIAAFITAVISFIGLNAPLAQFDSCKAGFCSPPVTGGGSNITFDASGTSSGTGWSNVASTGNATLTITPVAASPTVGVVFCDNFSSGGTVGASGPIKVSWAGTDMGAPVASTAFPETAPTYWNDYVFGLVNPPAGGAKTLTVTFTNYGSTSGNYGSCVAYTFTNSNTSTALDTGNVGSCGNTSGCGNAEGTSVSDTISSGISSGDMALDFVVTGGTPTFTPGGGQTGVTATTATASSYKLISGSSVTMSQSWTGANTFFMHLVAAVKHP